MGMQRNALRAVFEKKITFALDYGRFSHQQNRRNSIRKGG